MKKTMFEINRLIVGLKFLVLLFCGSIVLSFLIQSCERNESINGDTGKANADFTNALKENRKSISNISFSKNIKGANRLAPGTNEIATYLQFPGNTSPETITLFQNANSIQELAALIDNNDAILQYEPTDTNSENQINLPLDEIRDSLDPLVQESKEFLYTKGLTDADIQQMIAEENAEETDLIPLVMAITQAENGQLVTSNEFSFMPVNMAYAKINWNQVGHCAMHALGVDILFSLGASSATVWSAVAIRSAFKTVAKRMLGPIGVAIAVVDFGFCMSGVEI